MPRCGIGLSKKKSFHTISLLFSSLTFGIAVSILHVSEAGYSEGVLLVICTFLHIPTSGKLRFAAIRRWWWLNGNNCAVLTKWGVRNSLPTAAHIGQDHQLELEGKCWWKASKPFRHILPYKANFGQVWALLAAAKMKRIINSIVIVSDNGWRLVRLDAANPQQLIPLQAATLPQTFSMTVVAC